MSRSFTISRDVEARDVFDAIRLALYPADVQLLGLVPERYTVSPGAVYSASIALLRDADRREYKVSFRCRRTNTLGYYRVQLKLTSKERAALFPQTGTPNTNAVHPEMSSTPTV